MAFQAERARAHLAEGLRCSTRSTGAARSASATFAGLYRATLDRIEAGGFDVFGEKTRLSAPREARCRGAGAAAVKVAVVGGGLAGLAAALDLVDAGHAVTRATRRGRRSAAQCRRCRSARAIPSRRPTTASTSRSAASPSTSASSSASAKAARSCGPGSALPVLDEDGRGRRRSSRACRRCSATATCRCGTASGSRSSRLRLRAAQTRPGETFGELLRRLGDVRRGDRPVLGRLRAPGAQPPRATRSTRGAGLFTVRTALLGPRANSDLVLPTRPLGRCTATRPALRSAPPARRCNARRASRRSTSSTPTRSSSQYRRARARALLGEPAPELEDSPIVSVHLWFDRPLLEQPLAALLGSDAHWVFDRGALTGHGPSGGSTSPSSRAACPSCSTYAVASSWS